MPLPKSSDDAAYAQNWRAVLLADALLGAVVAVAGAVGVGFGHPLAVIAVLVGGAYMLLVGRRYRRWKRLRASRQSG